jgi:hypothetical protein
MCRNSKQITFIGGRPDDPQEFILCRELGNAKNERGQKFSLEIKCYHDTLSEHGGWRMWGG